MCEEHRTQFMINEKKIYISLNCQLIENKSTGSIRKIVKRLWKQLRFNEWTFTLLLFTFSLSILLGKLSLNHRPSNRYNYLFKATFSGLATIGITWFIIYKDSTVPGVNPPSPFSPIKRRSIESQSLQINYFVGFLNGLLIFFYMCI
ncbi:PREDICTED: uncharacterized protein LOC105359927 [Ceratosolen solmsi marchali]|uniref:Uncharacterized protein LOC105359927 n=1 Tax=Ceratosolen solmsi marchali TaxID=326594 RepID=A0AAJ6VLL9_9HYME|nr:PREDICTED: uncharacterized protein LOC105359927 [Ceratosolen solmsi marchali]